MNIKIISEKPVFKAELFTVTQTEFEVNNKKLVQHDIIRNPVVIVFALTDKNELCLITQYRRILGKNSLETVAGFIDDGEEPLAAAKRELKEEAGLTAKNWKELMKVYTAGSVTKGEAHIFLATDLTEGQPEPEVDEEITLLKMPLEQAVQKAISGEIEIATTIAGILLIDKLKSLNKL